MATLTAETKNKILADFSELLKQRSDFLISENLRDLTEQKPTLSQSLYARLKLDDSKIGELRKGISDLSSFPDPIGKVQWVRELDQDLVLERKTVPLGVVAVIFESRPDVTPQILSLAIKSGNVVLLKGGKEAHHTHLAFAQIIDELQKLNPLMPQHWAQFLDSRAEVNEMLKYPEYIDLVVPRGSNQLVQTVMAASMIPVLGHADGICHLYIDQSADLAKALPVIIDSKAQYPAACNALETLLVDKRLGVSFLNLLQDAAQKNQIVLRGCPWTQSHLPSIEAVATWSHEYGDLTLAVKGVTGLAEAIDHINDYGSHHTDGILAQDEKSIEQFLAKVDSASVFANASTRFADGYRFGMGAEVGISTAKTHARGPVGIEGLLSYKYLLRGTGQLVKDYSGPKARAFTHRDLNPPIT